MSQFYTTSKFLKATNISYWQRKDTSSLAMVHISLEVSLAEYHYSHLHWRLKTINKTHKMGRSEGLGKYGQRNIPEVSSSTTYNGFVVTAVAAPSPDAKCLVLYISSPSFWLIERTDIGAEGTTEGRKQNINKSKSWKIGEIKDKEVNQTARDSDDALICCVENKVEDRIMDSGASFHATYCKEVLERFKLRSGKLDEEGYHVGFEDQQWKVTKGSLVVARRNKRESLIGMSMLASKGNVPDVRHVDIYFCKLGGLGKQKNLSFIMSMKIRKLQRLEQVHTEGCGPTFIALISGSRYYDTVIKDGSRSCDRCNANFQFGVAERLSQTFRVESTGIRVEAPKMLWADSVSTTYLIYRIPYILIGLRIPEEEWRGNDTSLTHLKVFGCDSFVKVKDVCEEAMKCTFIGSVSDEVRYSFRDTKSYQVIRSRDIIFVDSIYGARSGSSDTSEGSENNGTFEDSGRPDEENSEDGAFFEEGGSETPQEKLVRILISEWSLSFVEDSWNEKPCSDVHQVGDEREVKVLRSFNWPLSELITDDDVLPGRGYS
ncbi:retrovirus-related pol polyprotein from transposon TNT 1-94 [Tanacetum coccineum]